MKHPLFTRSARNFAVVLVILIIGVSYGLFFYFQTITERQIRDSLFEQQKNRQTEKTTALSQHIESDLSRISARLEVLAQEPDLQHGDLSSDAARELAKDAFEQLSMELNRADYNNEEAYPVIDGLFLVDKNDVITVNIRPPGLQKFEGAVVSSRDLAQRTEAAVAPTFSTGFQGLDGIFRISASSPILSDDNEYLGRVRVSMPTDSFFRHYGNIYDIESQYLAVLDIDSVQLAHPVQAFVGTPFFGDVTQEATGRNEALNNLIRMVLSGQPGYSVYEFRNSERLTTGAPVLVQGKPTYFVFIITPTSVIYSQVNDILLVQRIETFSLLAGISASAVILIVLLLMWNSTLDKAVNLRTDQLRESNKQLELANERLLEINERLEANEKVQKEFINVAAHELRTPIQPIIGLTEILQSKTTDEETLMLLNTINRNGRRLQRLASDILDVSKIEGHSLKLSRKMLDLQEILSHAVEDSENQIQNGGKVRILLQKPREKLFVYGDEERLNQVMSNLLNNAAKFTDEGTITVSSEKTADGKILVIIKDTGTGIDPELIPRLFTKFGTFSEKGTGLGLFISKSILEAHGGYIYAANNPDGRGATFSFVLPSSDDRKQ